MPEINRDEVEISREVHGQPPWKAIMNRLRNGGLLLAAFSAACLEPASARLLAPASAAHSPPFTATLSNTAPLAFGMDVEGVARALGTPLNYISGRPSEEIYLTFRNLGGSGLFVHQHRLFLQFRKGRLAGWKGD